MNLKQGAMDEETRAALASGRADPGVALFIDTLLSLRGIEDATSEAVAAAQLEGETPSDLSPDALARTFAAIDAPATSAKGGAKPVAEGAPKSYPELIRLPQRLQAVAREAEARRGWEYAGPGMRSLQLRTGGAVKTQLLRILPGAGPPRHTHYGREASLCLIGGFSDSFGTYGPGEVSLTDPSITHRPVADKDGVSFVLILTDARLKFTGVFRLLQKLMGG